MEAEHPGLRGVFGHAAEFVAHGDPPIEAPPRDAGAEDEQGEKIERGFVAAAELQGIAAHRFSESGSVSRITAF